MTDYGSAVSWVSDMAPEGHVVTGNRVVAEALARRLMTPRGRLIGYPNYGYDLTQFVNADMSERDLIAMQAGIKAECEKDERVESASVASVLRSDGLMTVTINVVGAKGPFSLVLEVSAVTVKLLEVAA